MGKAEETKIIIVILAILFFPLVYSLDCEAQTVDDLYAVYGFVVPDSAPDTLKKTVMAYNNAQIYTVKYKDISAVIADYTAVKQRIADYEAQIEYCSASLQNGYALPLSTILEMEAKIAYFEKQIAYLQSSMDETELDVPAINIEDIPSRTEYIAASKELEKYSSFQLGTVNGIHYPVTGEVIGLSVSGQLNVFKIPETASVLSLFHGIVAEVDGDYVRVSHGNNVCTEYFGLSTVGVSIGDELSQYQRIGSARRQFQMTMSLNGTYSDLSVLFEGGSE